MYQLKGGSDHHQDHGSLFIPPSIELISSAILDCSVNIFIDTWPPELIRDKALHSLALVSHVTMTTINGSPVCPWHYEAFHFINLVFWHISMVQQSSTQGRLVCISQQAFLCGSVLVRTEARLELQ